MRVALYLDSGDVDEMRRYASDPRLAGVTTNPSMMARAGVTDYKAFARTVLTVIPDKPISFQVVTNDFAEMERQARYINRWSVHALAKIPIVNAAGESSLKVIQRLSHQGMALNITAVMVLEQVQAILDVVHPSAHTIISVYAGLIGDSGRDPVPVMRDAARLTSPYPEVHLLWAGVREGLSIVDADQCGCDVVTVPPSVWAKLSRFGQALDVLSREAMQAFSHDAERFHYTLGKEV